MKLNLNRKITGFMAFVVISASPAWASKGTGNGTDGLYIKYKKAAEYAEEIFRTIDPRSISDKDVREFYETNRALMREDLAALASDTGQRLLQVRSEVKGWVDGKLQTVKASTGSTPSSPVLINSAFHAHGEPMELFIHTIIHEVGHHTGYEDENKRRPFDGERLLDRLGTLLIEKIFEIDPEFEKRIQSPVVVQIVSGTGFELEKNNSAHIVTWLTLFTASGDVNPFPRAHGHVLKNIKVVREAFEEEHSRTAFRGGHDGIRKLAEQIDWSFSSQFNATRTLGSRSDTVQKIASLIVKMRDKGLVVFADALDLLYTFNESENTFDVSAALLDDTFPVATGNRTALTTERRRISKMYGPRYNDLVAFMND